MNKWLGLLLGLVLLLLPIVVALQSSAWGSAALSFIMGAVIVVVALVGILFIMLGVGDFSN